MSAKTIPAARLREQFDFNMRLLSRAAHTYARLLRANRIDWLAAHRNINEMRAQARIVRNALSAVAFDMPDVRADIERIRKDFEAQMDALQTDLRENCLLNGPKQRAA